MMTVSITPEGRTVIRSSVDTHGKEIVVSRKLSKREHERALRAATRDARMRRAASLRGEAVQIVAQGMRGVTRGDE